ncbi:polymorphic toxin-type HINT domain-containing protein [Micromonospora sp. WMMD710]|uniref:polymorphic toxin-type HINT domain-containing protein n=1 Tax=Micromonospora sp. WMMD710 TaxID=3016085 RepID=UPI0024159B9A|nr:polymorphic toxin-type HINT domain-containing protein [Micromonospora sp. WMMD710]MDG4756613.1 polymorphic toxin-type HINT domain-containing protein [Micromonospora sp. WMMD710]
MLSLLPYLPAQAAAPRQPSKPPAEKLDHDGGPVAAGKAWQQNRVTSGRTPAPKWPAPAAARVDLAPASARAASSRGVQAGSLPVWVDRGTGKAGEPLAQVDVKIVDRASLPQAWRDGLMMQVTVPQGAPTGVTKVSVNYDSFRYAVGGSWASRLRLWQVPGCAMNDPANPNCRSVPLRTVNDAAAGVATAEVGITSGTTAAGSYLMLAAAAAGSDGDFGATSLAPSSTWSSGGSAGDFSWNYPLRIPPATGPAPSIALSYSSSAVDGRSEVTNNQPSWIGEGFDYSSGYIERRYVPCADDLKNGANNTASSGDQCWRSDNATLSLNGHGGELIYQAGKGWHSRSEDGSKIEKLTGAANGDSGDPAYGDVGEYWKVTTTDGTQYFFGLHNLPGQATGTNSTLTVPVFGNHTGEPCHKSTFTGSDCVQAWRWNLDYVVDVRGNTMSFWYGKETNKYARNVTDSDDVTYDRAGYLTRIDYGTYDRTTATHGVTERSTNPYAQVLFETDLRCFSNCGTETAPVTSSWKDTPWDQECKASATSCPQQYSPTFWTTKRLKAVTTRVWDTTKSTPDWQNVEAWTLSHTFSATADSTHEGLWLDRIDHTGLVGGTINLPPVTFGAESLPNRVYTEHGTTDNWLRISSIVTETGARIKVDYSPTECTAAIVAALDPHDNTRRCYPVVVPDPADPTGKALVTEWWHKYRVEHVAEDDVQLAGGHQSPTKHTWYEYVGSPAWHFDDDDGLTRPDRKTWGQWRGYGQVKTRVGDDGNPQTLAVTTFMRGMHGDKLSPSGGTRSVTVPASLGAEIVYDEDQFAGQVREQVVYNGVDTKPVSKTVNVPWRSKATASRTINGDLVEARFVNTQTTYAATALGVDGSRGWRTSRGTSSFDDTYGTTNWSQDDGEFPKTGDENCITYTYNRNLGKNLTQVVKQTTTTALTCDKSPTSVDDVISDARTYYDGATSVDTAPTFGSTTKTEQLNDWTPGTGTVWQATSQATYDYAGRQKTSTDIRGNVTTTAYTPAVGGPVTLVTSTNQLNWQSKVETNPYWGSTTKSTDPNGKVTSEARYDALGRVARVWTQGWTSAANPNNPSAQYTYTFAAGRDNYPYITSKSLNATGNYITSYQILDGLMRPRQTQSLSLGGGSDRVVTDTVYDEYGRAAASYPAHAELGAPAGALWWEPDWSLPAVSRTVYDQASRATNSIFLAGDDDTNLVEKWRTVTSFEGDLTKVTPPKGGTPTTTVTDIEGRTVALRQHTTPAGVNGAYLETTYTFNRKGQATTTTDSAGNEWTNEYDAKGRLWRTKDPDKGTTTSTFYDDDSLQKTVDARGNALWYVYDQLGRKTQVRDDSAIGRLRTEWKYDTLFSGQSGFKGQLTQSIRYEYDSAGTVSAYKWQAGGFNERYQLTAANYVIPPVETGLDKTYPYTYGYSRFTGAPTSISYPSGGGLVTEQLTTGYDATTGMPVRLDTSLTGSVGTMATATYTAYGERKSSIYKVPGNSDSFTQDVVYRDEATRRIKRTTVELSTVAGTVSDRNYFYQDAGNFESITDTPEVGQADTQCFRDDALGRLNTAWTPKTGISCDGDPGLDNLGGPAPYWQDWTLDDTGSRLTETSHTSSGDTTRGYRVPDGGPGVVRPHAVTQMTTDAPGQPTNVAKYEYDEAGNTTCRPSGTTTNTCDTSKAGSQTLAWDAEGKLATVSAGGNTIETNIYDADGVRLIRRDTTGTTLYLPGQELRREGTVTTGTRYYSFAGNVCASRKASSAVTDLTWLYSDHQGTQQLSINAGTQKVDLRRQTPYGAPRGASTTWVNGKGFVGGDIDPTNLTNIGARQYDQTLGRFISVDPVMDLSDPQQWNAYSYANNSPITSSDPTGLNPFDAQWDGAPPSKQSQQNMDSAYGTASYNSATRPPSVEDQVAAQQAKVRQEAERKQRECRASFWCRHAGAVGAVAGIAAGVIVGGICTAGSFGIGAVGCAAIGGFVGGAVSSLVTDGLDAEDESIWQLAGGAIGAGLLGAAFGAGGVLLGAAAFGGGVALTSGMGLKASGQMAMGAMRSSLSGSGGGAAGGLRGCLTNSFVPGTAVVLANGTTKAIEDIAVGDEVLATDPETGQTLPETVSATIAGQGSKNLVKIITDIDGDNGDATGAVIATDGHPFWVPELGQWRDATDLQPGQWLQTSAGTYVQITAVRRWTQSARVYNLSVTEIHTYYVVAGTTPVLVHNCGDAAKHSVDNLADSLGDDVFFHYTDEAGHATIMGGGVVKANSKGVSYFTQDMVKSGDANNVLFAGNPRYAGRGSHVIGFRISPDRLGPGVQPNELVHQGSFRFTPDDVIYHGPNPFG